MHRVPSSEGFAFAVESGLGWGMLTEEQLGDGFEAGRLVPLPGARALDVPLFWQRWRIASPALDRLTDAVRTAAGSLRGSSRASGSC